MIEIKCVSDFLPQLVPDYKTKTNTERTRRYFSVLQLRKDCLVFTGTVINKPSCPVEWLMEADILNHSIIENRCTDSPYYRKDEDYLAF